MGLFDSLKGKLWRMAFSRVDAAGAKRWPLGWIKLRRGLKGWKTVTGFLIWQTPAILEWFATTFPELMANAGLDQYTAGVVRGVGVVLVSVGSMHKLLKFTQPLERRGDERVAAVIPILATREQVALSKLEAEVFRAETAKRLEEGKSRDLARMEALELVKPEVKAVLDGAAKGLK